MAGTVPQLGGFSKATLTLESQQDNRDNAKVLVDVKSHPIFIPNTPIKDEIISPDMLQRLRHTLPAGWEVDKTLDEKYLFVGPRGFSWKHPKSTYVDTSYFRKPHLVGETFEWLVPRFVALSCSWESHEAEDEVSIETDYFLSTHNTESTQVRKSLADALRHMEHGTPFWSDTLCLEKNEANMDAGERRKKIGQYDRDVSLERMKHIYPLAEYVIIWLGEDQDDSTHALKTLRDLSEQVQYAVETNRWVAAQDTKALEWVKNGVALGWNEKTWNSISLLLTRPWFASEWGFEEARLCERAVLQCGLESIDWFDFRRAMRFLQHKSSLLPPDIAICLSSSLNERLAGISTVRAEEDIAYSEARIQAEEQAEAQKD